MANDLSLSLRIPSMLMARLEDLRTHLEADPDLAYLGEDLSRSMLVRLALQRGVEALEALYGVAPVTTGTQRLPAGTAKVYRTPTEKIGRDSTRKHRRTTEPMRQPVPDREEELMEAEAAMAAVDASGSHDGLSRAD
ncbi:MAG: hypothetical protein AB7K09_23295 [Planctomycetota bacterium]